MVFENLYSTSKTYSALYSEALSVTEP